MTSCMDPVHLQHSVQGADRADVQGEVTMGKRTRNMKRPWSDSSSCTTSSMVLQAAVRCDAQLGCAHPRMRCAWHPCMSYKTAQYKCNTTAERPA